LTFLERFSDGFTFKLFFRSSYKFKLKLVNKILNAKASCGNDNSRIASNTTISSIVAVVTLVKSRDMILQNVLEFTPVKYAEGVVIWKIFVMICRSEC